MLSKKKKGSKRSPFFVLYIEPQRFSDVASILKVTWTRRPTGNLIWFSKNRTFKRFFEFLEPLGFLLSNPKGSKNSNKPVDHPFLIPPFYLFFIFIRLENM